jgi:hypothetical protein
MFLERRHHAVVSMPWFEWAELSGIEEKTQFIVDGLRQGLILVHFSTHRQRFLWDSAYTQGAHLGVAQRVVSRC